MRKFRVKQRALHAFVFRRNIYRNKNIRGTAGFNLSVLESKIPCRQFHLGFFFEFVVHLLMSWKFIVLFQNVIIFNVWVFGKIERLLYFRWVMAIQRDLEFQMKLYLWFCVAFFLIFCSTEKGAVQFFKNFIAHWQFFIAFVIFIST